MTMAEFTTKYVLHDSIIEAFDYDDKNTKVIITVNFCFWLQEDYNESDPENGLLKFTFNHVSNLKYDNDVDFSNASILKTDENDGTVIITLLDDLSGECYELSFSADNVEINTVG